MDADDVRKEAEKRVTLSKGELWMLRIAAASGVVSVLSHGAVVIGWVLDAVDGARALAVSSANATPATPKQTPEKTLVRGPAGGR